MCFNRLLLQRVQKKKCVSIDFGVNGRIPEPTLTLFWQQNKSREQGAKATVRFTYRTKNAHKPGMQS